MSNEDALFNTQAIQREVETVEKSLDQLTKEFNKLNGLRITAVQKELDTLAKSGSSAAKSISSSVSFALDELKRAQKDYYQSAIGEAKKAAAERLQVAKAEARDVIFLSKEVYKLDIDNLKAANAAKLAENARAASALAAQRAANDAKELDIFLRQASKRGIPVSTVAGPFSNFKSPDSAAAVAESTRYQETLARMSRQDAEADAVYVAARKDSLTRGKVEILRVAKDQLVLLNTQIKETADQESARYQSTLKGMAERESDADARYVAMRKDSLTRGKTLILKAAKENLAEMEKAAAASMSASSAATRSMQVAMNNASGAYHTYNPKTGAAGSLTQPIDSNAVTNVTRLQKSIAGLTDISREAHSAVHGLTTSINGLGILSGSLLPLLAGAVISISAISAIKLGAELERSLFTIGTLAGNSVGELIKVKEALMHISENSKYGPIEAAHALETLTLAGLSAQQALVALKPTLDFSAAGGVDAKAGAETLVAVGTAYGYLADKQQDAAITGAAFNTVGDIIAKTAADTMSSVATMSESFKTSSVVAQQYGVTLQDTAQSLGMLAQIGIVGTAAGTSFRNMVVELNKESGRAGDTMKTLGVKVQDSATNKMRPLVDVMGDITKEMVKYTAIDQRKILENITNERGAKDFAAFQATLMRAVKDANPAIMEQIDHLRKIGDSAGVAALQTKAITAAVENLKQKAQEASDKSAAFSFFASFAEASTPLAQGKQIIGQWQTAVIGAFDLVSDRVYLMAVAIKSALSSEAFKSGINSLVSGVVSVAEGTITATKFLYEHRDAVLIVSAAYLVAFSGVGKAIAATIAAANFAPVMAGIMKLETAMVSMVPAIAAVEVGMVGAGGAATTASLGFAAATATVTLGISVLIALGVAAIAAAVSYESSASRIKKAALESAKAVVDSARAQKDAAVEANKSEDQRIREKDKFNADYETGLKNGKKPEAAKLDAEENFARSNSMITTNKEYASRIVLALGEADLKIQEKQKELDSGWARLSDSSASKAAKSKALEAEIIEIRNGANREVQAIVAGDAVKRDARLAAFNRQTDAAKKQASDALAQQKENNVFFHGNETLPDPKAAAKAAREANRLKPDYANAKNELEGIQALHKANTTAIDLENKKELDLLKFYYDTRFYTYNEYQRKLEQAQGIAYDKRRDELIKELSETGAAETKLLEAAGNNKMKAGGVQGDLDKYAASIKLLLNKLQELDNANLGRLRGAFVDAAKQQIDMVDKFPELLAQIKEETKLEVEKNNVKDDVVGLSEREATVQAKTLDFMKKINKELVTKRLLLAKAELDGVYANMDKSGEIGEAARKLYAQATEEIAALQKQANNTAAEVAVAYGSAFDNAKIKKFADELNVALVDSIMNAGKDGGESLRKTLKNILLREPFKILLQGVLQSVTGQIAGAVMGSSSGGGLLGIAGGAKDAYSLYGAATGYSGGVNTVAGLMGAGSTAGASAASLAYANGVGAIGGDGLGALIASNASWGGVVADVGTGIGGLTIAATELAASNAALGVSIGLSTAEATAAAVAAGEAAGATAAAPILAGMGPVGWIALAAIAAYAMFGGPGKPTSSTGDSNISYDKFGQESSRENVSLRSFYKAFSTTDSDNMVKGVKDSYVAAAKALGITTSESRFSYGGNTGKGGEEPNFSLSGGAGSSYYNSGEVRASPEAITQESARLLLVSLQGSELPKYLKGIFDGFDAKSMSTDQINSVLDRANAFATLHKQLDQLPFQNLKDLSFDAARGLIAAAGGLENLSTNLSSYYDNFYTAEEKKAKTIENINKATEGSGLDAATATRAQFRAIVDAQDVTTISGQKMYVALLAVASSFADITEVADVVVESLADLKSKAIDNMEVARKNLISAYKREQDSLTETSDKMKVFGKSIREVRDELRQGSLSTLTPGQKYKEAKDAYTATAALAAAGDETALSNIGKVSKDFLEASRTIYSSSTQYTTDFDDVQATLNKSANSALAKADIADLQLTALNKQLGWLNKIDDSVMSVATALTNYNNVKASLDKVDPLEGLYVGLLGRASDPEGKANWQKQLDSGMSIGAVEAAFKVSSEYMSVHGPEMIEGLYNTLLGRPADKDGKAAFVEALKSGRTLESIKTAILESAEYTLISTKVVEELFIKLLNKPASAESLSYYTEALKSGRNLESISEAMVEADQNDKDIVALLEGIYQSTLGRASDPQGLSDWTKALQSGTSVDSIIAAFKASPEYLNGSHASGLSIVPFDGYRAELHKGERVMTARDNQIFSSANWNNSSSGDDKTNEKMIAALIAEVKSLKEAVDTLRKENNQGHEINARATHVASAKNADTVTTARSKTAWSKSPELS